MTTVLRTGWRCTVVVAVLAVACDKPVQELKKVVRAARRTGPQILATVVTVRTTLQPANKATTTTVVIADDLARATEEAGEWRLFDLKENRVAFVNDFAKTYRYESLQAMRDRHDDASSDELSPKTPRVEYAVTNIHRDILGVPATQSIVKLGGYRREIWFGSHPLIPPQLFALMQASRAPGPDAPVSKRLDDALLTMTGFPLADHAELPYAKTKIVVDRNVVSIEQKNVAATMLDIPETYREAKSGPRPAPRPKPVAPLPVATSTATTAATATVPTATVPTATVPTATVPATTVPTATAPTSTSVAPVEPSTRETVGPPKPPVEHKKKPVVTRKPTPAKAPAKKAPAKKESAKKAPAKTKKSSTKKPS